jgi:hypothetical protein
MPKRRVPGHLQRRSRRRDDARPNVPASPPPLEPSQTPPIGPEAGAAPAPSGRPLRPTQRMAGPGRFARSATPAPEVEIDYRPVMADLRQLGLWAGIAFAILIALTFIIR